MKNLEETIKLLEHIYDNPEATQRELVEKLDISLGKVNFLINEMAKRGVIKLKRFKNSRNKNGYLYLLTPKGVVEKALITKEFLEDRLEEYERIKKEIEVLKAQVGEGRL